jgi:transposase InsO family protein
VFGRWRGLRAFSAPGQPTSERRNWAPARSVKVKLIDPGHPNQNAYIESLDGRFRDAGLNEHWFTSLAHARPSSRQMQRGAAEEIVTR